MFLVNSTSSIPEKKILDGTCNAARPRVLMTTPPVTMPVYLAASQAQLVHASEHEASSMVASVAASVASHTEVVAQLKALEQGASAASAARAGETRKLRTSLQAATAHKIRVQELLDGAKASVTDVESSVVKANRGVTRAVDEISRTDTSFGSAVAIARLSSSAPVQSVRSAPPVVQVRPRSNVINVPISGSYNSVDRPAQPQRPLVATQPPANRAIATPMARSMGVHPAFSATAMPFASGPVTSRGQIVLPTEASAKAFNTLEGLQRRVNERMMASSKALLANQAARAEMERLVQELASATTTQAAAERAVALAEAAQAESDLAYKAVSEQLAEAERKLASLADEIERMNEQLDSSDASSGEEDVDGSERVQFGSKVATRVSRELKDSKSDPGSSRALEGADQSPAEGDSVPSEADEAPGASEKATDLKKSNPPHFGPRKHARRG